MPDPLVQLGVAGVAVAILAYVFKLVIDGRLHTDGEINVRDKRIEELLKTNETLTAALKASNDQSGAIVKLLRTLQSEEEERVR